MSNSSRTDISTQVFTTGMIKDLNNSFTPEKTITHARNGLMNTHVGDTPVYSNEPANLECISLPYKFNGSISLRDNKYLICSTDNTHSEIGLFDATICKYTELANDSCLNFNQEYIVTGVVHEDDDNNQIITINDGFNPPRVLNPKSLPYLYYLLNDVCNTKINTKQLDCDSLLVFPTFDIPCITINTISQGNIKDGTYQAGVSYSKSDIRFSDVYGLTTPVFINNDSGSSGLSIHIDNLDRSFDNYLLYIISNTEAGSIIYNVGEYETYQDTVVISDLADPSFTIESNTEFTNTKIVYDLAGNVIANSSYLMFSDLTRKKQINVQELANKVELEYVVKQVPLEYYKNDGKDIGFYRDEVYQFHLRYIWDTGDFTERGVIPNRRPTNSDLEIVNGDNVYETSRDCTNNLKPYRWRVYNTAGSMVRIASNTTRCGNIIGKGEFAYHESSELYPNDKELFGDNACSPIRLHRFPDEEKVPRYQIINGVKYINILGFRPKNIPLPIIDNKIIKRVVGWEILRSDRTSDNKTVVARGLISNMRGYTKDNSKFLYSNYPYNDLSPDPFFSSKKVYKTAKGREMDFIPLNTVYKDKFAFYSPHCSFFTPYKLGQELIIESEEVANISSYYEEVYKHPKSKLITSKTLLFAATMGIVEAYLATVGKAEIDNVIKTTLVDSGLTSSIKKVETAFSAAGKAISPPSGSNPQAIIDWVIKAPAYILAASVTVFNFFSIAASFATQILDTIRNFTGYEQFAYQLNSDSNFVRSIPVKESSKRRLLKSQPEYIQEHLQNVNGFTINNYKKQDFVYLELAKEISNPTTKDNSRNTLSSVKSCDDPNKKISSTASMYYATSKISNPSIYGKIGSTQVVKTHNCIYDFECLPEAIFGGDCIIYEYNVNTKQPIFTQDLGNTEFPDGQEYDYRNYHNIGYPRYWADFTDYNLGSLVNLLGKNPQLSSLPVQKHNLDCVSKSNETFTLSGEKMYTSINGVLSFIVEADYNIAFRKTENEETQTGIFQPHYNSKNKNLSYIFRADHIWKRESFNLNPGYKKLVSNQLYSEPLLELEERPIREKNSIIYSLPHKNTNRFDAWRYFLPNNYYTFDEQQFGTLTGIHSLDQDKVIFLFSKASPFVSIGRDQLETVDGRKITIGDGGLFAQQPRELMHTDVYYGSNHDKYAFRSTQFGHFYISRNQGKIFKFSNNLDEISRNGLKYWCQEYIPLQLTKDFPNYINTNQPQNGIGYQIAFDNFYETVYICKRDFKLRTEFKDKVTYNSDKDQFYHELKPILLGDIKYFWDSSFTLSYSPSTSKEGSFVSFHDWHPDWVIQQENHFMTVKGNKI